MTSRERRIAEAVRAACVAEFSTRADALRERAAGYSTKAEGARVMEIVHGIDANAALLRALDVAAVVATVSAAPDPSDRMREHLRERMDSMLECPPMWGGDQAVELQMLSALEMLHVVERPEDTRPRVILDSWIAFINRRFETSLPLAEILKRKGREAEFVALMGEFRAYVEERLSRPAAATVPAEDAAPVVYDVTGPIAEGMAVAGGVVIEVLMREYATPADIAWCRVRHPTGVTFATLRRVRGDEIVTTTHGSVRERSRGAQ